MYIESISDRSSMHDCRLRIIFELLRSSANSATLLNLVQSGESLMYNKNIVFNATILNNILMARHRPTRDLSLLFGRCWTSVADGGPALILHRFGVLCMLGARRKAVDHIRIWRLDIVCSDGCQALHQQSFLYSLTIGRHRLQ